tara:strand:+ start:22 stop:303 length:282 start_codon:yes stop_codon:yes gene_type:complete
MSVNFNMIAPISATVLSIGGLIFQMGKHSEKLDVINTTVYAQEKKVNDNYKYINDMKLFITRTDERLDKINDINDDLKEIKHKLEKIECKIYK